MFLSVQIILYSLMSNLLTMTVRTRPTIREFIVVDDPDTMKLVISGKYNNILELIDSCEMSVSDIARVLKINPGSAHYHIKELEKRGLVMMVGEETKGNVVKKYYRTAARNIYLDGSRFKTLRPGETNPMDEYCDKMFRLMAPFGYDLSPEKAGLLKDALHRHDKRKKDLVRQVQDAGVENIEEDRLLVGDAYSTALLFREIEDEELRSIREELRVLISEFGDHK